MATNDKIDVPKPNTSKTKSNTKLTPNNPVTIFYKNNQDHLKEL